MNLIVDNMVLSIHAVFMIISIHVAFMKFSIHVVDVKISLHFHNMVIGLPLQVSGPRFEMFRLPHPQHIGEEPR